MLSHEFVKVKEIPSNIECIFIMKSLYSTKTYPSELFITISDDFVLENIENVFMKIIAYNYRYDEIIVGLAYHGQTNFNLEQSQALIDALKADCEPGVERDKLIEFLSQAIKDEMYVIHFGI